MAAQGSGYENDSEIRLTCSFQAPLKGGAALTEKAKPDTVIARNQSQSGLKQFLGYLP